MTDPVRQAHTERRRRQLAMFTVRRQALAEPDTRPPQRRPVESLTAGAARPSYEPPNAENWIRGLLGNDT